jgi:ABC-type protease/lipase transport system fused ATPase/permease subunit
MGSEGSRKVTTVRVFAAGTLLALVIAVPAVTVTLVMHYLLKMNLILTAVAGIITLFVAMAFGYKLSKKLAKIQGSDSDLEKK